MTDLSRLRKSYERAALDEDSALADPIEQFQHWPAQAIDAELPEPTAMTLATVGADGRPSTRVVLIKGCDALGFVCGSTAMPESTLNLRGTSSAKC